MTLIAWIEQRSATEDSYFQQVLLREDVERFKRLDVQLAASDTIDAFRKRALYAGWSADDMRTHELIPKLEPLLAVYWEHAHKRAPLTDVVSAWHAFHDLRMQRLVGCLARVSVPDVEAP